jgi:hypothetical protein
LSSEFACHSSFPIQIPLAKKTEESLMHRKTLVFWSSKQQQSQLVWRPWWYLLNATFFWSVREKSR